MGIRVCREFFDRRAVAVACSAVHARKNQRLAAVTRKRSGRGASCRFSAFAPSRLGKLFCESSLRFCALPDCRAQRREGFFSDGRRVFRADVCLRRHAHRGVFLFQRRIRRRERLHRRTGARCARGMRRVGVFRCRRARCARILYIPQAQTQFMSVRSAQRRAGNIGHGLLRQR